MSRVLDSERIFAVGFVGLALAIALAFPANAVGQRRDRERDREADELDLQRRSFNLRMLHIMAKQRRMRRSSPQLALAQVQDDFTHIQLINKKLGLAALGDANLDLSFVTKAAAEINTRADRLKENLALPAAETTEPFTYRVGHANELRAAIVDLARLILDFTDNPYFKEAAVLEAQQANKARGDLDNIIALSERIRDVSRRLVQTGGIAPAEVAQDPQAKQALDALYRKEIPEATLPCSPDEAKWWEELRAASTEATRGGQAAEQVLRLMKEGRNKSYPAPIPDRGITVLRRVPPRYSEEARRLKVSGGVAMVVEFLNDGTIGEIKIVKGLGAGLDEKAAEAVRQIVFLPTVKNAQFVSAKLPITMSFDVY